MSSCRPSSPTEFEGVLLEPSPTSLGRACRSFAPAVSSCRHGPEEEEKLKKTAKRRKAREKRRRRRREKKKKTERERERKNLLRSFFSTTGRASVSQRFSSDKTLLLSLSALSRRFSEKNQKNAALVEASFSVAVCPPPFCFLVLPLLLLLALEPIIICEKERGRRAQEKEDENWQRRAFCADAESAGGSQTACSSSPPRREKKTERQKERTKEAREAPRCG